ncbi:RNA polymerase sigma factor [Microbispora sp. CA-102843]|uniref:RNA polymerase sigma factor n=1 Tax=Microbispora sp. CA-102843 TaxID=3239952 RepID=UPI003D8D5FCB
MIPEAPADRADDAELIRRSRRDPEAFADLFDRHDSALHRHASALHRYVTRRLGASLADDVVSDTFLTAFRKRERYDLTRPDARPWLYGITANLIGRHAPYGDPVLPGAGEDRGGRGR